MRNFSSLLFSIFEVFQICTPKQKDRYIRRNPLTVSAQIDCSCFGLLYFQLCNKNCLQTKWHEFSFFERTVSFR